MCRVLFWEGRIEAWYEDVTDVLVMCFLSRVICYPMEADMFVVLGNENLLQTFKNL